MDVLKTSDIDFVLNNPYTPGEKDYKNWRIYNQFYNATHPDRFFIPGLSTRENLSNGEKSLEIEESEWQASKRGERKINGLIHLIKMKTRIIGYNSTFEGFTTPNCFKQVAHDRAYSSGDLLIQEHMRGKYVEGSDKKLGIIFTEQVFASLKGLNESKKVLVYSPKGDRRVNNYYKTHLAIDEIYDEERGIWYLYIVL